MSDGNDLRPIAVEIIAFAVIGIWMAATIVGFFDAGYNMPPSLHVAVGTVVGGIFAKSLITRKNGGNGNGNGNGHIH